MDDYYHNLLKNASLPGAMQKKLLVIILFVLLILGCTPENSIKANAMNKAKLKSNGTDTSMLQINASLGLINATTNATDNAMGNNNSLEENSAFFVEEGIRIRRLSNEEYEQQNRNSQDIEKLREKRYSTRIDLTKVTGYNCKVVIEDLKKQLRHLADDVRQIDNDLKEKEIEVMRTKIALAEAQQSGADELTLKEKKFDYNDAEDEYDKLRKEDKQVHDDYNELDRTKKIVEKECVEMRNDAGLED